MLYFRFALIYFASIGEYYTGLPLTNQSLCQSRGPTIECPAVWRNSWSWVQSNNHLWMLQGRFVQSSIIQRSLWDYEFNRLPKQIHIWIHLFIVLNRRVCFILFYRVSAHINKQEVCMVHVQVRKIFSSPTNRRWKYFPYLPVAPYPPLI